MIVQNVRKMFALFSRRMSPVEKKRYEKAENEFTSEGAPPPEKPAVTPERKTGSE